MRKNDFPNRGLGAAPRWVLLLLLSCLIPTSVCRADLTPAQERGKTIYQSGKSTTTKQEIIAYFGAERIALPAETSPCASCHGYDGTGRPESGLFPSNITWKFLTKAYGHLHQNGVEHPPFNPDNLKPYLKNGLYPGNIDGSDPQMPLYEMAGQDLDDLIAYMQQLGKLHETGVSETGIRIGTLLPGPGPLAAVGQEINNILKTYFNQINHNGGVYGRKLELVTLLLPSDQKLSTAQIEAWLTEHQPFSLLSTFLPSAETELGAAIRTQNIPLVGPFTLFPSATFAQNRQTFYLYPGLSEQMQTLLHFVSQKIPLDRPQIAVLYPQQARLDSVLAGIGQASRERHWENPLEIALGSESTKQLIDRLEKAAIDLVIFLGDERQTGQFLQTAADANWSPYILGSGILAGKTIIEGPELFSERIFLSYPTLPVDRQDWGLKELYQLQRDAKRPATHIQASISAYSSAKVLVEALRLSGRKIDRKRLVSMLEQLNKFATGLTPPISYSGNRHIGVQGTHVIRFSSARNPEKVLSGADWVERP